MLGKTAVHGGWASYEIKLLFFPPAHIIMPLYRKPIRPTGSDLFRNKMFTNRLYAPIMQSPCYGQVGHTAQVRDLTTAVHLVRD